MIDTLVVDKSWLDEYRAVIDRLFEPQGTYLGMKIVVSRFMPRDKMVMYGTGGDIIIIDLSPESEESKDDG
jgi:hypothetical protein